MKLGIMILNWNKYELTRKCLMSLESALRPEYEVIIIDNGSTDGSLEKLKREFPSYTYIGNEKNIGFSAGSNVGLRYAVGRDFEYFFLLNNDTEIISRNCLEVMLDYMDEHHEVGVLGPKLVFPDGSDQASAKSLPTIFNQFYFDWFFLKKIFHLKKEKEGKIREAGYVSGAFVIRKSVVDKIGLLDERFFYGHEDQDWCKRVWGIGSKVIYFPETSIIHIGGASGPHLRNLNHYFQGKLIYFAKYHSVFYTSFFRLLVSCGALIRALTGYIRGRKIYADDYFQLSHKIWFFPGNITKKDN